MVVLASAVCLYRRRPGSVFSRQGTDDAEDTPLLISSVLRSDTTGSQNEPTLFRRAISKYNTGTVLRRVPSDDQLTSLSPLEELMDVIPTPKTPNKPHQKGSRPQRPVLESSYPSSNVLPTTSDRRRGGTLLERRRSRHVQTRSQIGLWRDGVTAFDHGAHQAVAEELLDNQVALDWQLSTGSTHNANSCVPRPELSIVIPVNDRKKPVQAAPRRRRSSLPKSLSIGQRPGSSARPSTAIPRTTIDASSAPVSPVAVEDVATAFPVPRSPATLRYATSHLSLSSSSSGEASHASDDQTSCYSRKSSRTSVESNGADITKVQGPPSIAKRGRESMSNIFSVLDPTKAGVFDESSIANLNKPLPPSPGPGADLFNPKRSSIAKPIKSKSAKSLKTRHSSLDSSKAVSTPKSCKSLHRLNTFDDEFRKTDPYSEASTPPSPTLSEAVSDLREKLCQIPPLKPQSAKRHARKQSRESKSGKRGSSTTSEGNVCTRTNSLQSVPTVPARSRRRQWQACAAPSGEVLSPVLSIGRRNSASNLEGIEARSAEGAIPVRRPSVRRHSTSATTQQPADTPKHKLPSVACQDSPEQMPANAVAVEGIRIDSRTTTRQPDAAFVAEEGKGVPGIVTDLVDKFPSPPQARIAIPKTPAESARLSILTPTAEYYDGLIPVKTPITPNFAKGTHTARSAPQAAELVLLQIMSSLPTLADLAKCACINKGMRRAYQRNELALLKAVYKNQSVAAWELREWTPPVKLTADGDAIELDYSARDYQRFIREDARVVAELKKLISQRCQSFLRPETTAALSSADYEAVQRLDSAFYRVWSFCRIFGCGKGREEDVTGQLDWLKGGLVALQQECGATVNTNLDFDMGSVLLNAPDHFGVCNLGGLSADELYDMAEVWIALAALLQGFAGNVEQARTHGVFATTGTKPGDVQEEERLLEEWIFHIMTLGLPAVLKLAEQTNDVHAGFALARINGWMNWSPPGTRSGRGSFLRDPVSRLYEDRVMAPSSSATKITLEEETNETSRKRVALLAQEIRLARHSSEYKRLPLITMSQERPWSVLSRQQLSHQPSLESMASQKGASSPPGFALPFSPPTPSWHPSTRPLGAPWSPRKVSPIVEEGKIQPLPYLGPSNVTDLSTSFVRSTGVVAADVPPKAAAITGLRKPKPAIPKKSAARPGVSEQEVLVKRIVDLGFTSGQALQALRLTAMNDGCFDVEQATDMLLKACCS